MENEIDNRKVISMMKEESIKLIANAKCFIVITDDGKVCERRAIIDNPRVALTFLGQMEVFKNDLLLPGNLNPPPSNIVKP